jgi:endogenous inhibitor of DNA gyrase (YacG/DUF329 family)
MNLSLVDPFVLAQDCPEALTSTIRKPNTHYEPFKCSLFIQEVDTRPVSASATAEISWLQEEYVVPLSGSTTFSHSPHPTA